ncbi:MAG: hypothetical protein ACK4UJ_11330 [Leptonema sp. (in: bacteria)]
MYPILAIFDLSNKKKAILKEMLVSKRFSIIENFSLFYLNRPFKRIVFLELDWNQLLTLQNANFPYIILTDYKNNTIEFKKQFLEENFTCLYFLGNPIHWELPIFPIPKRNRLAIFANLILFKNIYKNIFEFNGFRTITISSHIELNFILERESQNQKEIFLITDLDKNHSFLDFFQTVHKLIQNNDSLQKSLRLILLKDTKDPFFSELLSLKNYLTFKKYELPPIKMIFDYHHFIFVLLETLFLPSPKKIDTLSLPSLKDYLIDSNLNYEEKKLYKLYKKNYLMNRALFKKISPFLWLYEVVPLKEIPINSLTLG